MFHIIFQKFDEFSFLILSQGRGIGIAIGCILGMFPLLFIDPVDDEEKEHPKYT